MSTLGYEEYALGRFIKRRQCRSHGMREDRILHFGARVLCAYKVFVALGGYHSSIEQIKDGFHYYAIRWREPQ